MFTLFTLARRMLRYPEVGSLFSAISCALMTGLSLTNPNSSEIIQHFSCMILLVYLGHGILHPVYRSSFIFSLESALWRGLKLPNPGTSENKWCTSVVALTCRNIHGTNLSSKNNTSCTPGKTSDTGVSRSLQNMSSRIISTL